MGCDSGKPLHIYVNTCKYVYTRKQKPTALKPAANQPKLLKVQHGSTLAISSHLTSFPGLSEIKEPRKGSRFCRSELGQRDRKLGSAVRHLTVQFGERHQMAELGDGVPVGGLSTCPQRQGRPSPASHHCCPLTSLSPMRAASCLARWSIRLTCLMGLIRASA